MWWNGVNDGGGVEAMAVEINNWVWQHGNRGVEG